MLQSSQLNLQQLTNISKILLISNHHRLLMISILAPNKLNIAQIEHDRQNLQNRLNLPLRQIQLELFHELEEFLCVVEVGDGVGLRL